MKREVLIDTALQGFYEKHKNKSKEGMDAEVLDLMCRLTPDERAASFIFMWSLTQSERYGMYNYLKHKYDDT